MEPNLKRDQFVRLPSLDLMNLRSDDYSVIRISRKVVNNYESARNVSLSEPWRFASNVRMLEPLTLLRSEGVCNTIPY